LTRYILVSDTVLNFAM